MKKFLIVFSLIFILFPIILLSASVFDDDFNSYNNGNLPGQGSWTDSLNGNDYDVESTKVYEGAKAVYVKAVTDTNAIVRKTGTARTDGSIRFYIWPISLGSSDNNNFYLENSSSEGLFAINWDYYNNGYFTFRASSNIQLGAITTGDWNTLDIEWRSSDHKGRARSNEGTWSDWTTQISSRTGDPYQVALQANPNLRGEWYIDYIYGPETPPTPVVLSVLDYHFIRAILILGIFILILFDFIRRVAEKKWN